MTGTILTGLLFLHFSFPAFCQDIPAGREQQLEQLADAEQVDTEDDAWLQELERFRKDPLQVNSADEDELRQLRILNDLQIASLVSYRRLFGKLISLYELQAVPNWDLSTIKKLLPYIALSAGGLHKGEVVNRFRGGERSLLLRVSQQFSGRNSVADNSYMGPPVRVLFRFRYNYKNLLQWGVLGDKDAGEPFLKDAQKLGFDFYSVHLFARKLGAVQSLALGDFTVNMGQGLIHWQSLAFRKSAEITSVKRQSPVLRPYHSAGEYFFHRGAGITIRRGKLETTAFVSLRKLSANLEEDPVTQVLYVRSVLTGGYHRSPAELADRNRLTQTAMGAVLRYSGLNSQVSLNGVANFFSLPLKKKEEPYNLFALAGKQWYNLGADYSYTYKNTHFFGEAALDKNFNWAFVNGLLLSAGPHADISLLHRNIGTGYQSVSGNAFTESSSPANERGVFAGISIRQATGWKIDAYADLYRMPWLRFRVDAPGRGSDWMARLSYSPNRQTEIYTRYRSESKLGNAPVVSGNMNRPCFLGRQSWRTHLSFSINKEIILRYRVELVWFDKKGPAAEKGYLFFSDVIYKPLLQPYSGSFRIQYFETGGYNSRIYAYENDVLYSNSIPGFSGKGMRLYLNLAFEPTPKLSFWVRVSRSFYRPGPNDPPGALAGGDRGPDLTIQARHIF